LLEFIIDDNNNKIWSLIMKKFLLIMGMSGFLLVSILQADQPSAIFTDYQELTVDMPDAPKKPTGVVPVIKDELNEQGRQVRFELEQEFKRQKEELEAKFKEWRKQVMAEVIGMVVVFLKEKLPSMIKDAIANSSSGITKTVKGWFGWNEKPEEKVQTQPINTNNLTIYSPEFD
jgi:hypothetical protein